MSLLFVVALLTVLSGYLVNQLPAFKNIPGKNIFIFRVLGMVVALSIILSALNDEKTVAKLPWLKTGGWVVGGLLIFDCLQMAWALWQHRNTPEREAEANAAELRAELLKVVAQEIQDRQRQNFKNLEPQVVMPLQMQDVSEQVGQPTLVPPQNIPQALPPEPAWRWLTIPVKRFFRRENQSATEIPATRRLIEVFRQANQRLLVLGKPGAGKTTLLLELAEQLLQDAQQPGKTQIPVRIECSSWKDDRQPLEDWLVLQLKDKYNVPIRVSQAWIKQQALVPLLDGLDELGLVRQKQATLAIADFIRTTHYPTLVNAT